MTDLVATTETAERLRVMRRQVVHDWRHRHSDFAQPVAAFKQALVCAWSDVEAWARKPGRL